MSTASAATLLVFTRGPHRERSRRRLLPEAAGGLERQLYQRCLDEAVGAGREVGLQVKVASPERLELDGSIEPLRQRGDCFGSRLRDAMARSADKETPLVVVGTDAPGLTAGHLRDSLALLRDDPRRVVVGPSPDGGFYLLATGQPLDRELGEVRWCRRSTLRSLLAALARAGRPVSLLAPLADLDRRSDLERWLAGRRTGPAPAWHRLTRLLQAVLAELRRLAADVAPSRPTLLPVRLARPRGPPPR